MAATCDRCGITLPPGDRHFVGGQELCGSCHARAGATPLEANAQEAQSGREYFYGRDGKQNGPLTQSEFFRAVADGTVRATDLVFVSGWSDWKRLDAAHGAIPGLPPGPALESQPKKMRGLGLGCLGVIFLFFVLAVIGAIVDPPADRSQQGTTATSPPAGVTASPSFSTKSEFLTASQRNAVRSADSYLKLQRFSRQGLIDQLSSDYGDQFSVADATIAVDSLDVDWRTQAARSAAAYLKLSGFSCRGLIEQLSSQSGDKYTVEEATYGATQAGIC